jgi:hypothetical protein
MKKRNVFLSIPLIWFSLIWCIFVLHIKINVDFIPQLLWVLMLFIGTPLLFLSGFIYTIKSRIWHWLAIYSILGGIPVIYYFLGVLIE